MKRQSAEVFKQKARHKGISKIRHHKRNSKPQKKEIIVSVDGVMIGKVGD